MSYKFFDKRYLVMPDDESIVGKKVFYNDNLSDLIKEVEQGDLSQVNTLDNIIDTDYKETDFCFEVNNAAWCLIYYDPNYEAKVAYSQGKIIEYRRKGNDEWNVSADGVVDEGHYEYRVKPDEPASDAERKYVPYDSVSEMMYDHFNVDCVEDIKNCIWLRSKSDTNMRFMITGTDVDEVMVDSIWLNPSQLLDDYLWDDYTAIGK